MSERMGKIELVRLSLAGALLGICIATLINSSLASQSIGAGGGFGIALLLLLKSQYKTTP